MTAFAACSRISFAIDISINGNGLSEAEVRHHVLRVLSSENNNNDIQDIALARFHGVRDRIRGKVLLRPSLNEIRIVKKYARKLRESKYKGESIHAQLDPNATEMKRQQFAPKDRDILDSNGEELDKDFNGKIVWKDSKLTAARFFLWSHQENLDLSAIDRHQVHCLFKTFYRQQSEAATVTALSENQQRKQEGLVMAMLRKQKLLRSKRYNDGVVVCSFARLDKSFAPVQERQTARDRLREQHRERLSDKGGVVVDKEPTTDPNSEVLPINRNVIVEYTIQLDSRDAEMPVKLEDVQLEMHHRKYFSVLTKTPVPLLPTETGNSTKVQLSFRGTATAVYRANITFCLQDGKGMRFSILRSILLRSGDANMYDIVKPKTPYAKKERRKFEKPFAKAHVVHPPPRQNGANFGYKNLESYKIPIHVKELVENKEMEAMLVQPTPDATPDKEFGMEYSTFWKNLLWTSELQAYEDIKLFDMKNAELIRANGGRSLKLYVEGLAEGRPSVLRGDLVLCLYEGKQWRGRVSAIEQLHIVMEFDPSFHKRFNTNVDRVDLVRFTFGRTSFRTSHAGVARAPNAMGQAMLMPQPQHFSSIVKNEHQRTHRYCPENFPWASPTLNPEQKQAVHQIAAGIMRPMPHIIFGPPGTGKTTTIVEVVFQLANLHSYDKTNKQPKLKILLVAPSNDACDILVEKLAPYFPPSEMIRALAYTRTINQVPDAVRPYCREGLEPNQLIQDIVTVQITIATVNMASKLWCTGDSVPKGYFDVLCVDEAGHATEPEVIAVAATLMNFKGKSPGQLVLAGDPMQLGPIITSGLCKKFGMEQSYMERLVRTSQAYKTNQDGKYPPELLTYLVNNYRSHPDILRLPNHMFYHNKLVPCGDHFNTHSMAKWEHLPKEGFPIVFHSVDGENNREGSSPSWFNPQEALVAVDYVKKLVKHSRPAIRQAEIGIITPYNRQVQKIRLALKASNLEDVKVGSVETFQGQERRVIIISTVRSENELLSHDRKYNLGFVANEKRFNVAVTRAKALLIVVGNPCVLATDKKNWLPLLRFCKENGSWLGEEWEEEAPPDCENDSFERIDHGTGKDDESSASETGWEIVAEEAQGFINREE